MQTGQPVIHAVAQVQISKSCTQLIANKRITQINHHHQPYNSNLRVIRIKRPNGSRQREKPTRTRLHNQHLSVCVCVHVCARARTQMQMSALKFCPRFAAQRERNSDE